MTRTYNCHTAKQQHRHNTANWWHHKLLTIQFTPIHPFLLNNRRHSNDDLLSWRYPSLRQHGWHCSYVFLVSLDGNVTFVKFWEHSVIASQQDGCHGDISALLYSISFQKAGQQASNVIRGVTTKATVDDIVTSKPRKWNRSPHMAWRVTAKTTLDNHIMSEERKARGWCQPLWLGSGWNWRAISQKSTSLNRRQYSKQLQKILRWWVVVFPL